MVFDKHKKETYPIEGDILGVTSIYDTRNLKFKSKVIVRERFLDGDIYIGFTPLGILYSNETLIWINIESNIFTYVKNTLLLERIKVLSLGDEPWTNWINE